jgi:transposase
VFDQINQLPEIKEIRPDVAAVFSQVLQDVLRRLDKTYQAFFLRVKRGQKAGFPRFQCSHRQPGENVTIVDHLEANGAVS